MDPTADLPRPAPPDVLAPDMLPTQKAEPLAEQGRPQESQGFSALRTPESRLKAAEDAVRASIEGEQLGSERSKEFCDYVDLLRAMQDQSEAGKMRKALIMETRRQRGNESEEYSRATLEIFGPRHNLEQEILDQAITRRRGQGDSSRDWIVEGRAQIAESFSKIKEEYLNGKLKQAAGGPAISEPVPSSPATQFTPAA